MYNRVVVPLDGSAAAEGALTAAIEFARLAGATIHLVRVVDTSWMTRYGVVGLPIVAESVGDILIEERNVAEDYLAEMRTRVGMTGIPVTVELREGRAADEIRAAVLPGDLLTIATHGRSGISRLAVGSVAEEVARRMETPVLLCRTSGTPVELESQPATVADREVIASPVS